MNLNEGNAPQKPRNCQGLAAASAVERNVLLTLQSPLGIPFGFPVSGNDQAMRAAISNEVGEICLIGHASRAGTHDSVGSSALKCR